MLVCELVTRLEVDVKDDELDELANVETGVTEASVDDTLVLPDETEDPEDVLELVT